MPITPLGTKIVKRPHPQLFVNQIGPGSLANMSHNLAVTSD